MSFQHKPNSGSLWRNDKKETEKHPDHTGTLNVEGREYWLSAWVNDANGKKYFSLKVKPKDEQQRQAAPPPQQSAPPPGDFDDDIPF
jgi:hypothetical protein